MSNTKKIAIMSTLVLLLAVTAVFNFVLAGTSADAAADGTAQEDYFTSFRTERVTTRNEEFLQLDSVIAAYAADSSEYKEAVAEKQRMVEVMETELVIETMIKTLGFTDAVVAIGAESDNINIFVNSSELSTENVTRIFSMIEDELGIRSGNIVIMPIYAES